MNIRLMTIEDYDKIYDLWENALGVGLSEADERNAIYNFLERNKGLSFVSESDNEIIGTILCGHDGRRGYIYHLAVKENQRFKGIGRQLVQKALDALKQVGILKCHIFVFENNELGKGFWSGNGWKLRADIAIFSKNIE